MELWPALDCHWAYQAHLVWALSPNSFDGGGSARASARVQFRCAPSFSTRQLLVERLPLKTLNLPSRLNLYCLSGVQQMVKLSDLWEADEMKMPELTDAGWLGPRDDNESRKSRLREVL